MAVCDLAAPEQLLQGEGDEHAVAPGTIPAPSTLTAREPVRVSTPSHDAELMSKLTRDVRMFVGTPGPFLKPVQCYIIREKASGGLLTKAPHVYKLYCESNEIFLLGAMRRQMTKSPSYIVSLEEKHMQREGPGYYGKIKVCLSPRPVAP
jgi:hypothetical protein